jgi:uncharacterized membrane protein YkoI
MKGLWRSLAVVLMAAMLAGPAAAQVRIQPYGGAIPPRKVLPPAILVIKPSEALRIALQAAPAAKALGVQLRGPIYVVKLKQGNKIMQVRVDAASGALR